MKPRAIIFDLDDTLIPEEPHVCQAYATACEIARLRYGVDPASLQAAVHQAARRGLRESPWAEACTALGIASWETMSADFNGGELRERNLHAWLSEHRLGAWRAGLREHGITDDALAAELSERFCRERLSQPYHAFPEAGEILRELSQTYRLALITNGLEILQHAKLRGAGLTDFFDPLVVSEALGVGKPDPRIFRHTMERFGLRAAEAIMVGNSLAADIAGAGAVGISTVWIGNVGEIPAKGAKPNYQISALSELPKVLRTIPD